MTEAEQGALRGKAGLRLPEWAALANNTSAHACRLGIGAFNIADFDTFDIVNFNRQAGALVSTTWPA